MSLRWRPPTLSLVWVGTLAFFVVEMSLLIAYGRRWYDRDAIEFFATIVGGAFALFAYLKGIQAERDREAGRYIERWNAPEMKDIKNRVRPFVEKRLNSADFALPAYKPDLDSDNLRGDIIFILGFFEEIAISIEQRSASEDRLQEFFGAVMPNGYDGLEEFVLHERDNGHDDDYYKPSQRVVERWTRVRRRDRLKG